MTDDIERIRIYGNTVLRKHAEKITEFDENLRRLSDRMVETLFAHENGIALAAPQIDVSRKLVVIDLSFGEEYDKILTMVNPEILETEGEDILEEGCLSVPGIFEEVVRSKKIHVRFQNLDGDMKEIETDDFLARVIRCWSLSFISNNQLR